MNAVKSRLNNVAASIVPYAATIQMVLFVTISLVIIYVIYSVLFPAPDTQEQVILDSTTAANSLGPNGATGLYTKLSKNVTIETGGEYTFSTWMYISNWDYRAGQPKHVFQIAGGSSSTTSGRPDHLTMVGVIYPNENKLAIRVYQDMTTVPGATASTMPDLTVTSTISSVFGSGSITAGQVFNQTIGYPICDINNIDLQKWICLTIVVNGRVVDVYIDGKLARSCVTAGIPRVETGVNSVTLGAHGGWGGNISTTRVFGYALSPGKIYEMYQSGPAVPPAQYGFLGWLYQRVGFQIQRLEDDVAYYSGYSYTSATGGSTKT